MAWTPFRLPPKILSLPGCTRLLGVHASPGADDGNGVNPRQSDDELAALVAHCGADLVVGHTHVPLDRTVAGVRVVNVGSVSNPVTPELRAMYVLLDATRSGYTVHRRRVSSCVPMTLGATPPLSP